MKTDPRLSLDDLPGHGIRRLQQIAVALFMREVEAYGLTPVQYGVLRTVRDSTGIDQRTLARSMALDTSTTAGVVDRLEARGLLVRSTPADDRRMRMLALTAAGTALLDEATPAALAAQKRMLAPLPAAERTVFMRMLRRLVAAHKDASRVAGED
jgi:DNA-binding MarR family transcriptional regulator